MMFWRKLRRTSKIELEEAIRADEESQKSLTEARETYRDTLQVARVAKAVNARNHFSERLNEAYGG